VEIVMQKYGCSFWKALRIAAEDLDLVSKSSSRDVYKLIEIPKVESSLTNLQVQIKDYSKDELEWWDSFGITKQTLDKYNVFSVKTTFINGAIHTFSSPTSPIFGYYFGKKDDIEVWKIYLPKNKNKGYRFLTNAKESVIQGWKQLPASGDMIVVTKALKDVMLFNEFGIAACAPNSETVFLAESIIEQLKARFKKIYVVFDNDIAGISAMRKLKKIYPEFTYAFIPRRYAKDISDFCKRFGKDKTRKFINKYLNNEYTKNTGAI
jgi:hypothetical protein